MPQLNIEQTFDFRATEDEPLLSFVICKVPVELVHKCAKKNSRGQWLELAFIQHNYLPHNFFNV